MQGLRQAPCPAGGEGYSCQWSVPASVPASSRVPRPQHQQALHPPEQHHEVHVEASPRLALPLPGGHGQARPPRLLRDHQEADGPGHDQEEA